MRKIYFSLLLLFLLGNSTDVTSQTISAATYPFTASTDVLEDMSSGTTTLVGSLSDDGASALTNIGFTYYYVGVPYTQFSASANGYIRLGGAIQSAGATADYTNNLGSLNQAPAIAPYWDDLYTGTTGKVHYKVTGVAPNRKLVIEWAGEQVPRLATAVPGAATFQLWINESSGTIDFVYGSGMATNTTNSGASIGINKTAAVFASVTSTAATVSYATANDANTAAITAGTKYSFTPPGPTPAAPVSPSFTAVSTTSMTVNWVDNSTNETFFIVKRSLSAGGPFTTIGTVVSSTLAGTGTSYNLVSSGLFENTTYYYQVEAVNESSAPSSDLTANQATTAAGTVISTATGGLWSSPTTWLSGSVPTSSDIVTIADGATVTIDAAANAYALNIGQGTSGILNFENGTARTLTITTDINIQSGASFTSGSSAITTHSVILSRNLTNNGILDLASGTSGATLTFNGAINSDFTGTGSVSNLYILAGGKSSVAPIIDINLSNFSVRGLSSGATGALLTSNTGTGTIKFSGTNTFSGSLWSTASYTIPATMGIWINNPNFTVTGQTGSPTLAGLFRVSNGTYNIGIASGNSMGFNTGSSIIIDGGTVNAAGRFGVGAAANIISYNQSAGIVTVCTAGNSSTTLGSFDLGTSTGSVVSITGGTIITQLSATTIDYRNQAGTGILGVTGGTLQLGNASSGAAKTFNIRGVVPNLLLTNTSANHSAAWGTPATYNNISLNITVSTGTTMNFGNFVFLFNGSVLTNNGTITHNGTSSNFVTFLTTAPVLFTGTGTFTAPLNALSLQSDMGLTIDPALTGLTTLAFRLFSGNVTNANKITVGNGGTTTATVQIGNTTTPTNAGTLDVPLSFNAGTGGATLSVLRTNASRVISNELIPSRILSSLTIDENDPSHLITFSPGNISISSGTAPAFTFTNGKVNLNGNVLTLGLNGTSASLAGAMTTGSTAYMYNGQFKRWISATSGARNFPMGTATAKKDATINFTAIPAAAGSLTARWSSTTPSFPNAVPLTEGTLTVDAVAQGSWFIDAGDGLTGGTYTGTFIPNASTSVIDYTKTVLLKRPSSGGDWTLDGTHVTTTGSNSAPVLSRTGMSGFSEFAVGGQNLVALPVSIEYFKGSKLAGSNYLTWRINCTSAPSVDITLERSGDARSFKGIDQQNATAARCLQEFNYTDHSPLSGINYYRLRVVSPDGKISYSSIVALINKDKGFELISVAPNPVRSNTVLTISTVKGGIMTISVTDMNGRIVMKQNATVIAGSNAVNLDFDSLGAGTYHITAVDAEGEKKTTGFVKF